MSVQVRLLGGFEVVVRRRARRRRALGPPAGRRAGEAARPRAGAPAAPRAGHRGAVARAVVSRRPGRGCTRPPTTPGAPSATHGAVVLRNEHGGAAARTRRRPRRRRRVPRRRRSRRSETGDRDAAPPRRCAVRRTAAARGPLRAVGRGGARLAPGAAAPGPAAAAGAVGGRARARTRPTSRRTSPWSADHADRGDVRAAPAAARAARPGAAPRARDRAEPGGRAAAPGPGATSDGAAATPTSAPATDGGAPSGCSAARTSATRSAPSWNEPAPGEAVTLLVVRARRASASPPSSGWPRRWPGGGTGAWAAAAPRRSRGRGPTRRCSRRSASCAASTRPCSTVSTTTSGTEIERALSGQDVGWTGESSHQRLFVAVAELMRLAAAGPGLLLVVDDLQDADEASLRLLHYLVPLRRRRAGGDRGGPPGARTGPRPATWPTAWWREAAGTCIELEPLGAGGITTPARRPVPRPGRPEGRGDRPVGGGLPVRRARAGRSRASGSTGACPPPCRRMRLQTFQRVALLGSVVHHRRAARPRRRRRGRGLRPARVGAGCPAWSSRPRPAIRFRHALVREGLVRAAAAAPAVREPGARSRRRLAALGGPRAGRPTTSSPPGSLRGPCPTCVRAVETAGALGAYRDGLALIDGVRDHAGPERPAHPAGAPRGPADGAGRPGRGRGVRRGGAVTTGTEHRLVRARLARAAAVAGDLETARAALAGLELRGRRGGRLAAAGPRQHGLLRRRHRDGVGGRRRRLATDFAGSDDPWHVRGPGRAAGPVGPPPRGVVRAFRMELRRTQGHERLAAALFDAHLCVAEYLLYGPEPYLEVIDEAEELRQRARQGRRAARGGLRHRPDRRGGADDGRPRTGPSAS